MELLQRVKEIDIRMVARDLGFEIIQSRRMVCPFHFEDSPSLIFYPPPQNEFHCFGCGKHGDVINLYAETCHIDFKTALEELAIKYLPSYYSEKPIERKVKFRKVHLPKPPDEKPYVFKEIYSDIYQKLRDFCINQPPSDSAKRAAEYLRGRGIEDWVIKHFKVFVIKNYGNANDFLKNNFEFEDLRGCGLVNEKGNLVFFIHPIIFPYFKDEKIIYLQGRCIGIAPEHTSKYQFLSGVPRPMFNVDILKTLKTDSEVYITEGAIDCITLVKHGFAAVSLGSAKTYKKEWAKLFRRFNVKILFDNDSAGKQGTLDLMEELHLAGISVERRYIPQPYKDVNEYFQSFNK